mmetsp:Transcript_79949/g.232105  ORF Transcript_79949/g.232105 Transcript_79949/m.232105 type:complete len:278 (+) Transcript_79949:41-874(+)
MEAASLRDGIDGQRAYSSFRRLPDLCGVVVLGDFYHVQEGLRGVAHVRQGSQRGEPDSRILVVDHLCNLVREGRSSLAHVCQCLDRGTPQDHCVVVHEAADARCVARALRASRRHGLCGRYPHSHGSVGEEVVDLIRVLGDVLAHAPERVQGRRTDIGVGVFEACDDLADNGGLGARLCGQLAQSAACSRSHQRARVRNPLRQSVLEPPADIAQGGGRGHTNVRAAAAQQLHQLWARRGVLHGTQRGGRGASRNGEDAWMPCFNACDAERHLRQVLR